MDITGTPKNSIKRGISITVKEVVNTSYKKKGFSFFGIVFTIALFII